MTNTQARILVVDDAPLSRDLLEHALRKYGYAIDTADNGQQAIEYFINHHPDLILMDADMPVLDGVTACARIRELPEAKYLPIIIVTGLKDRQWVDRAYAAGATDYVTKPVNLHVLRNRIHYILQAKRTEEALFDEKEKAQITLASICDGVITTDAKGMVEFLNPVASQLTGWTTEEARGLPLSQVFSIIEDKTQQPLEFPIQRCLEEGKTVELKNNIILLHRQGKKRFAIENSAAPIKDRNGLMIGVILVFYNVTETRKMTRMLSYKATHDALTGLCNRHEFQTRLKYILQSPQDRNTEHALLYMDLDRFKIVNDTCGHEAGDQLLKDVALLLQNNIEAQATNAMLARLGGDEFGLLLEDCSKQKALEIANSLCESVERFRFFWSSHPKEKSIFTIGISIGLVPISIPTLNQKSILAMADAACYVAKNRGRNGVHIYQENESQSSFQAIQWVSLITDNLERDDGFSLFYQPIIPLQNCPNSNTPHCYEILLRMNDQHNHLVPPGAFLSAATRYNLMATLDLWIINQVCKWLTNHPNHLETLTFCTINISGYSLNEQHFLSKVISSLDKTDIPAQKLCFEISETTALTNLTGVLNFITTLKKRGCRFAVDNFGTGMASFAYLKQLPVDFVKIDGTWIKSIINDTVDYAMVKSINEIAHLMRLQTIAESVENQATVEKLKEIKVDYMQGYWIGEPKPLVVMENDSLT